jgi:hypothetical protein
LSHIGNLSLIDLLPTEFELELGGTLHVLDQRLNAVLA